MRLGVTLADYIKICVSIHAPARGATKWQMRLSKVLYQFQSTHPHGVRRLCGVRYTNARDVSIHAPARGATITFCLSAITCLFQSTHPHGVRRADLQALKAGDPVSIHAPARGATKKQTRRLTRRYCFNPRTRTGCDSGSPVTRRTQIRFNPRTRTGCDTH